MESLGIHVTSAFGACLRASFEASILIGVILGAKALLRRRLAVRWHYALWLLLVARMCLPWAPTASFSMFNLTPDIAISADATPDAPAAAPADPSPVTLAPPPAPMSQPHSVTAVLAWMWLMGVLGFSAYVAIENLRFWHRVRCVAHSEDPDLLALLNASKARMAVRSRVVLVVTDAAPSPALFGIVRPRLLLPPRLAAELSRDELRYVMLHELAHLKRWDIPLNWATAILQVIHWFNPVIWYAFYHMRADRELACDALVLSRSNAGESARYGRTIVGLFERVYAIRRLPGMAGILEDRSQLKRRIKHISLFTKHSYRWSILAVTLLGLLAAAALTNAQDEPAKEVTAGTGDTGAGSGKEMGRLSSESPSSSRRVSDPFTTIASATVGLSIRVNESDDLIVCLLVKGSGAEEAGVLLGDVVLKIDGITVGAEAIGQVAELLRGPYGTSVNLTLQRDGEDGHTHVITKNVVRTRVLPSPPAEVGPPTDGRPSLRAVLEHPVSLAFERVHLTAVVDSLAKQAGVAVYVDERVVAPAGTPTADADRYKTNGAVTFIRLEDVPLKEALSALLRPLNLDYALNEDFIWISTPLRLRTETFEPLESRTYVLANMNRAEAERVATLLEKSTPALFEPDSERVISYFRYDAGRNSVTAHNTPENLAVLEELLWRLGQIPNPTSRGFRRFGVEIERGIEPRMDANERQ